MRRTTAASIREDADDLGALPPPVLSRSTLDRITCCARRPGAVGRREVHVSEHVRLGVHQRAPVSQLRPQIGFHTTCATASSRLLAIVPEGEGGGDEGRRRACRLAGMERCICA